MVFFEVLLLGIYQLLALAKLAAAAAGRPAIYAHFFKKLA